MIFKKLRVSVEESREREQLVADNAKLKADLEYLAMMAEIDMDEEEGEE